MYTLMIVEDEAIIRTGLTDTIDWAGLGFSVVAVAKNGEEGLEKYKDIKPDVVLTDIRMPRMDGLSMARRIKELSPEAEIVLLSGYDEFSYARQGIEIGVYSYILKLNMFDDTRRVFTELAVRLDQSSKDKSHFNDLEHYKIRKKMEAAISGRGDGWFDTMDKMAVIAGYLKGTPPATGYSIQKDYICVHTVKGGMLTAIMGAKGMDNDTFSDRLSAFTRQIKASMVKGRVAVSAILASETEIKRGAADVYKLLDIARDNEDRLPTLLFCDRELENWLTRPPLLSYDDIIAPLPLMRYDHFMSCCVQWYDQAVRAKGVDMDGAKIMALRIALALNDAMRTSGIKRPEFEEDLRDALEESLSIIDIGRILIEQSKPVLKALERTNFHQAGAAIDEAVRYVDRNFDQALSIEVVAAQVHLSVPYFSSCFKKLTGSNYSVYLRKKRMERACNLLTGTTLRIYDIAHRVGYTDEKHFSKMFSKHMGISPNQYRKEGNNKK